MILLAWRDDVYVLGEAEVAVIANRVIDEYRDEITGVKESREKTCAYVPPNGHNDEEGWEESMRIVSETYIADISRHGIKMVGAPVGDGAYTHAFLSKAEAKYPHFLPRISSMDAQIAKTLLRECHLPIFTHLIRMIAPEFTKSYARRLDTSIAETYRIIDDQHTTNWDDVAK